MANREQLRILKQGVDAWNKWREEHPEITPDLKRADLAWADLAGANLGQAKLAEANLRWADLHRAYLGDADLGGADLTKADLDGAGLIYTDLPGAKLHGANLTGASLFMVELHGSDLDGAELTLADLYGANLCEADLHAANLRGADFENSNFTSAEVGFTVFGDNDLSTVKGLETVRHIGPSTIGIDTIYKSKGKIPEAFLRGAGVPEDFIVYMRSLVGKPIDFYSCFISYSSKDDDFAQRLYATYKGKTSVAGSLMKMPSGVSQRGPRLTPPSGITTSWW